VEVIVIVTGSKLWKDKNVVWNTLEEVYEEALQQQEKIPKKYSKHFPFDVGFEMFNGECEQGADLFATQWYEYVSKLEYKVSYRPFPARWNMCSDMCPPDFVQRKYKFKHIRYGQFGPYCPTAGMKRNREMVETAVIETPKHYVPGICLAFCLDDSPGTLNCGRLAKRRGFELRPYRMGRSTKRM